MKFSILTGTIGAILLVLTMSTVGTTAEKIQPKYITKCEMIGTTGSAWECKLVKNTMHVSPSTKWSKMRMDRETLPPVKTATKGSK